MGYDFYVPRSDLIHLTPEECEELFARVRRNLKIKRFAHWNHGKDLYEVRYSVVDDPLTQKEIPSFEFQGFDTWCQWADEELGLVRREAERHIQVYRKFGIELKGVFEVERDLLDHSKMHRICSLVTPQNCAEWIARARTMTCRELERARKAHSADAPTEYFHLGFELTLEEIEVCESALSQARRQLGHRRKGAALAALAREWVKSQKA